MLTGYHHTKSLFWLFEAGEFSSCSSYQQPLVQLSQQNGPSSWAQQSELRGDLRRIPSESSCRWQSGSVWWTQPDSQHWAECLSCRGGCLCPASHLTGPFQPSCKAPALSPPSHGAHLGQSPRPVLIPDSQTNTSAAWLLVLQQTTSFRNCPPQPNYPSSPATRPYVAALLIYMLILLSLLQRGELFVKNLTLQPEFRPSHYLPANLGRYG